MAGKVDAFLGRLDHRGYGKLEVASTGNDEGRLMSGDHYLSCQEPIFVAVRAAPSIAR